jgi:hypothetical protein
LPSKSSRSIKELIGSTAVLSLILEFALFIDSTDDEDVLWNMHASGCKAHLAEETADDHECY